MPKKKTRNKSKTALQKEIAKLKKLKKEAAERKALWLARKKEIEEIRKLRAEARELKGVGTKREVAKKLGLTGAKVGWKGLKSAGKFIKQKLEAEARAQDREAARARKKKR